MNEQIISKNAKQGNTCKFLPFSEVPEVKVSFNFSFFYIPKTDQSSIILFEQFGFGRFLGPYLVLTPYETYFLFLLKDDIGFNDKQQLWELCCSLCGKNVFPIKYAVYHYYRCMLWVVRDGSLFGSDFVMYCDHQELVHSSYIVSIVDDWEDIHGVARELSRVAWNVKKTVVLVRVKRDSDLNLNNPDCLSKMEIEAVNLKRMKYN